MACEDMQGTTGFRSGLSMVNVCYMVSHGSTGMNFVVMHVGTEWHCMCSYSYSVATQCHYDNVHNMTS